MQHALSRQSVSVTRTTNLIMVSFILPYFWFCWASNQKAPGPGKEHCCKHACLALQDAQRPTMPMWRSVMGAWLNISCRVSWTLLRWLRSEWHKSFMNDIMVSIRDAQVLFWSTVYTSSWNAFTKSASSHLPESLRTWPAFLVMAMI